MFPLRDENPADRAPVVTRALIALNAAAFLYELTLGPALRDFVAQWGVVPARVVLSLQGGEPLLAPALSFGSSMFLHGGWAHLIGNMWYLWIFGDNVEDRLGRAGYLVFYLVAGVVASIIHVLSNPGSVLPTVGASGAIAAVLGAYAVAYPRARVITLVPLFPFFQIMALPALLVLGLWFVFQFIIGTLSLGQGPGAGGVAWWAHIGGFVFGALVMHAFGRGRRPARSRARVEP
jgi:membrane associated rhomboid family serine protease